MSASTVGKTSSSSTSMYTSPAFWERLWRSAGIQAVGLFIATFVVKPPGTRLAVRLSLPQLEEPILVSGDVHWVREFSPSIEAPPGMGIALRSLSERHRRAVDAFMKVRPPLLHDD